MLLYDVLYRFYEADVADIKALIESGEISVNDCPLRVGSKRNWLYPVEAVRFLWYYRQIVQTYGNRAIAREYIIKTLKIEGQGEIRKSLTYIRLGEFAREHCKKIGDPALYNYCIENDHPIVVEDSLGKLPEKVVYVVPEGYEKKAEGRRQKAEKQGDNNTINFDVKPPIEPPESNSSDDDNQDNCSEETGVSLGELENLILELGVIVLVVAWTINARTKYAQEQAEQAPKEEQIKQEGEKPLLAAYTVVSTIPTFDWFEWVIPDGVA